MDYSGELAEIQQRIARSHDMASRRVRVLEALSAAPGERIVEVGCGAGFALREIGVAVGANGSAVGIDLSADQVQAASNHCADLTQVEARVGDLLAIPVADQDSDATVSMQVLEYVTDIETAVAELSRVTRPGGRFVNVATNWGSLFWSGGDEDMTDRILSVWQRHAPHPNLPIALPSILGASGFGGIHQSPLTIVNRHVHPNTFAHGAARLMAAFACTIGEVGPDSIDAWLTSLERADSHGVHFLSVVPVLTTAVRLG